MKKKVETPKHKKSVEIFKLYLLKAVLREVCSYQRLVKLVRSLFIRIWTKLDCFREIFHLQAQKNPFKPQSLGVFFASPEGSINFFDRPSLSFEKRRIDEK